MATSCAVPRLVHKRNSVAATVVLPLNWELISVMKISSHNTDCVPQGFIHKINPIAAMVALPNIGRYTAYCGIHIHTTS